MKHVDFRSLPGIAVCDAYGKTYRVTEADKDGEILVEIRRPLGDNLLEVVNIRTGAPYQIIDPETGRAQMPCGTWLEEGLSSGAITEVNPFRAIMSDNDEVLSQQDAKTIDPMSEARFLIMRDIAASGVSRGDPKLNAIISESWAKHGLEEKFGEQPTTRAFRRLMAKHDPATVTMGQLINHSGKVPRARRIDPLLLPLLMKAADSFYNEKGTRLRDACAGFEAAKKALNLERGAQGLPPVQGGSRETVRRMVAAMRDRERYARKYGEQAAVKNWDGGGKGLIALSIGELGMMDDQTLDAVICFDAISGLPAGRPSICILLDVHTRCIVGWFVSFDAPTAFTALATVRHANSLKDIPPSKLAQYPVLRRINCAFSEILVDNGANYASRAFMDSMADLGTTVSLGRVKRATDKNYVERFFFTLKTLLVEKLPGYTANPKLLRSFGYNPEEDACLTITELKELIEKAIYVYHITLHTGIGMQPAHKWQRSLESSGRRLITNLKEFDILTHEAVWDVTLHRWGFVLDGLRYENAQATQEILAAAGAQCVGIIPNGNRPVDAKEFESTVDGSDKIRPRRTQRRKTKSAGLGDEQATMVVKCKRNRANLGTIYVQHPLTKDYLPFRAQNLDYAEGISLGQHNVVRGFAKTANLAFNTEEDQLLARNELNEHIRSLAPELDARERKALARIAEKTQEVMVDVEEAFSEARRDGLDDVIETELPARDRVDSHRKPSRPRRGGVKGAKGSVGWMPDVNDGDEPLPARPARTARQDAAISAVGRADIDDDQKWQDFA